MCHCPASSPPFPVQSLLPVPIWMVVEKAHMAPGPWFTSLDQHRYSNEDISPYQCCHAFTEPQNHYGWKDLQRHQIQPLTNTTTPNKLYHQVPHLVIKYCTCECKLSKLQSCKPLLSRRSRRIFHSVFLRGAQAWRIQVQGKEPAVDHHPEWNANPTVIQNSRSAVTKKWDFCREKSHWEKHQSCCCGQNPAVAGTRLPRAAEVEKPTSASLFSTAKLPVMQKRRIYHVAS